MKKGIIAAFIAVLAVVLIVVFVAMGNKKDDNDKSSSSNSSNSSQSSNSGNESTQSGAVETDKVSIDNMAFEFDEIKVKKGTTVTWTNNDSVPHNVTGNEAGGPKSDTLQSGDTYSFTFDEVGSFGYKCTFHSGMTGKVTVVE